MDKSDNELKESLGLQLDNEEVFVSETLIQKTLQRIKEEYVITNPPKSKISGNKQWKRLAKVAAVFIIMFISYTVFTSKFSMKKEASDINNNVNNENSNIKGKEQNDELNGDTNDSGSDDLKSSESLSITADRVVNSMEADDSEYEYFNSEPEYINKIILYENIDLQKEIYNELTDTINNFSVLDGGDDLLNPDEEFREDFGSGKKELIAGNDNKLLYHIYFKADTWRSETAIYDSAYIYVCYTGSKESELIYKIQDMDGFIKTIDELMLKNGIN